MQAHRLIEVISTIQVPVVCAVRGWAAGLGFQLALAADFTIASDTARFWEPFCPRGFTPDSGATWFLPRLVGVARAKELLMLGRELSGTEAAEWGLILRCVADGELDAGVGSARRRPGEPRHDRVGVHQALREPVARLGADRRHGVGGLGAGAVLAHRRLPRGTRLVQGPSATRVPGPLARGS